MTLLDRIIGLPPVQITLAPGARLPAYATDGAAGMDLCALEDQFIFPGLRLRLRTGVSLALPPGYEAQVRGRSSLNYAGILCPTGTIDSDYRGEVQVILWNTTSEMRGFQAGDRIAQLVIAKVERVELAVVSELPATARGAGGFGSTGVR